MLRFHSSIGAPAVVFAVLVGASPARAQAPPTWSGDAKNAATAQALFDAARADIDSASFEVACPKLEEVVRLEPNGPGAKLKLAECYEGAQRLASAFAMYAIAETSARSAGQEERALWAHDRGAALKTRLSTITIVVHDPVAGIAGLGVSRGGAIVGRPQWGAAIPVDGGSVEIVVDAPGYIASRRSLEVRAEDDAVVYEVEPLAREEIAPPTQASSLPAATLTPPAPLARARSGRVPAWAWITGGLGLASAAVGVGFRIDGAVVESEQVDACGSARDRCPSSYDVDGTNAEKLRDFGLFVGLGGAGAVAVGVAVVGAIVGYEDDAGPSAPPIAFSFMPLAGGGVASVVGTFE